MSIRKQTRKSREIGMPPVRPLVEFRVSSAECRMTARSVSFCSRRKASQSSGPQQCGLPKASRSSALQVCGLTKVLRGFGVRRVFAGTSTAKVMLNREVTVPLARDRDWIESAWLTKRRQSAGPLERDAGGMKASRPSTCQ